MKEFEIDLAFLEMTDEEFESEVKTQNNNHDLGLMLKLLQEKEYSIPCLGGSMVTHKSYIL